MKNFNRVVIPFEQLTYKDGYRFERYDFENFTIQEMLYHIKSMVNCEVFESTNTVKVIFCNKVFTCKKEIPNLRKLRLRIGYFRNKKAMVYTHVLQEFTPLSLLLNKIKN